MPKFRVTAKFSGKKKRRELWANITAKSATEAIKKAKKQDKKIGGKALGRSWKARKVKTKRKSAFSIRDIIGFDLWE